MATAVTSQRLEEDSWREDLGELRRGFLLLFHLPESLCFGHLLPSRHEPVTLNRSQMVPHSPQW